MTRRVGDGYVTTVTLTRTGAYRHPMPVGVRSASGWTVVRGDANKDSEQLTIRTSEMPDAVWLDPFGVVDNPTGRFYRLTPRMSGR